MYDLQIVPPFHAMYPNLIFAVFYSIIWLWIHKIHLKFVVQVCLLTDIAYRDINIALFLLPRQMKYPNRFFVPQMVNHVQSVALAKRWLH